MGVVSDGGFDPSMRHRYYAQQGEMGVGSYLRPPCGDWREWKKQKESLPIGHDSRKNLVRNAGIEPATFSSGG